MDYNKLRLLIKNDVSIVDEISAHINLVKKGNNFWALCPFHEDANPSLSVTPNKKIFQCFSCKVGGDVIAFLTKINKWSFNQAVTYLVKKYNLNVDQSLLSINEFNYSEQDQKAIKVFESAARIFATNLFQPKNPIVLDFLKKRNLNQQILKDFDIGYAEPDGLSKLLLRQYDQFVLVNNSLMNKAGFDFFSNRIIFAIRNDRGDIVGFSGRSLDGKEPKYLNSAASSLFAKSTILYNFFKARSKIPNTNELIITEGFMDTIAFYRDSIFNVVALMGTSLTKNHLELIQGFKIILVLDGDDAGVLATLKSIQLLIEHKIFPEIVSCPKGYDPDEYFQENGKGSLTKLLSTKIGVFDFVYEHFKNKIKLNSASELSEFVNKMEVFLKFAPHKIQKIIVQKISYELNIPESSFNLKQSRFQYKNINKKTQNYQHQPSNYYNIPPSDDLNEINVPPSNHKKNANKSLERLNFLVILELQILLFLIENPEFVLGIKEKKYNFLKLENKIIFEQIVKKELNHSQKQEIMETLENKILELIEEEYRKNYKLENRNSYNDFLDWIELAKQHRAQFDTTNKINRIMESDDPNEQDELITQIYKKDY